MPVPPGKRVYGKVPTLPAEAVLKDSIQSQLLRASPNPKISGYGDLRTTGRLYHRTVPGVFGLPGEDAVVVRFTRPARTSRELATDRTYARWYIGIVRPSHLRGPGHKAWLGLSASCLKPRGNIVAPIQSNVKRYVARSLRLLYYKLYGKIKKQTNEQTVQ